MHLKVVLLSGEEPETSMLAEMLSEQALLTCVRNVPEMLRVLESGDYDAFFCDWEFPKGSWRDALETVRQRFPELPIIVIYRSGGEQEWVEVLGAGAYDLLAAPYSEHQLVSVLEHALAFRDAQRAVSKVA